jgi:hypothetical protein
MRNARRARDVGQTQLNFLEFNSQDNFQRAASGPP